MANDSCIGRMIVDLHPDEPHVDFRIDDRRAIGVSAPHRHHGGRGRQP